ncbi:lysosomal alpha-mannosidase-like [Rhopalosiphum maidis]|uniref:lysosomal alpha-mannosidase-like n=1 Tax=Rhopalosiphum maidis TaxID=43146 RepID=UPI000EFE08AC|nr:lysosomal alpha-mannosidase-like [Rhopalosiphum maidis]
MVVLPTGMAVRTVASFDRSPSRVVRYRFAAAAAAAVCVALCALLAQTTAAADHESSSSGCAPKSCNAIDPNKLNVHLIAHTHDDVGWLKTVDQYYYGSNKAHAPYGVQYILDSVVSELLKNKNRKFVFVETAFLWRWWEEQDEWNRNSLKMLVNEGRLQLLHGGWVMSDEAVPHYSTLIDQMTLGLKFLNDTFGECARPRVAWQIDPFGHSSEVAAEFAEMGFDGLVLGRIDHEDIALRKSQKTMEMVWRPDVNIGQGGELFTSVLYNLYVAPEGFCFDAFCNDDPILDNPKLHGYNVNAKVENFANHVQRYASAFKTNNIMMTMGGDFSYSVASSWFRNMDKLIKHVNLLKPNLNVLYSTPECYLSALQMSKNVTWPLKDSDDFFPYAHDEHSYWTGYFTSRSNLKYMICKANNLLQAVKQIGTILGGELNEHVQMLAIAVAQSQHHDAITGTEKQHVSDDYALYLDEGIGETQKVLTAAYRKWFGKEFPEQQYCKMLNISECDVSENNSKFVITLYNPLSRAVTTPVRIPVKYADYKVTGPNGANVPYELVFLPGQIFRLGGRTSNATHELVFIASEVSPLGLVNYHVERINEPEPPPRPTPHNSTEEVTIENGKLKIGFNGTSGLVQWIEQNGTRHQLQQNFFFYESMKGYNFNADNRASGAYIFRPTKNQPTVISEKINLTIYRGKNVHEVHQSFSSWLSQVVRIYDQQESIEFEWLVGPIPIMEWIGKEVITKYTTKIASNGTFYTDSNGRRWMKRKRNQRSSWNLTLTEPVASNYYPITSSIAIRDAIHQATIITDRPQGGTSIEDGTLELMLHRRLLYDDSQGVSEPLDENQYGEGMVTRGKHILHFNELDKAAKAHRLSALHTVMQPVVTLAPTHMESNEWVSKFSATYKLLNNSLPLNIHLLTLEHWRKDQVLLRIEHIFEKDEDRFLSLPETVHLQQLFSQLEVLEYKELTLSANLAKADLDRYRWNYSDKPQRPELNAPLPDNLLTPMAIKTYLLTVKPR